MDNDQFFSLICFLVLMQGLKDKESYYIREKYKIIEIGDSEFAFAELDIFNQKKVMDYCNCWKVEIPEKVKEYWEK